MKLHALFCRFVGTLFLLGTLSSSVTALLAETDPKFYAVEVSAATQVSPARVNLEWPADPNATTYTISRKAPSASSWTQVGTLPGTAVSFTDLNVTSGTSYEYQIVKNTTLGYKGHGFVLAGINAPLEDVRGKVILLVDNTHASALSAELSRLQQDLIGDGWSVIRKDVSRNDSVPSIKNIIKAEYNADPNNVKAVFLFGHIAIPYSGNFNPDGHDDHNGAWPADLYYGDMDGTWTDISVNNASAHRPANHNVPGDGKFDHTEIPSNVELAVGRVDLFNMTCFANKSPSRSELDLLRQYLNKDHSFRHRKFTLARRGLVCDNFGERDGEAFAASGWRNFAPFFGASNTVKVPYGTFFSTLNSQDYLWSYGTGGGSYYTCNGIGGSDDFALNDIKTVFTMFLGSYFGDWDNESNFLRAPLGSSSYTLTASWSGRPHWFYHHMGLGAPIGHSTKLSQNNPYNGLYGGPGYGSRMVHVALLGDPTLRMHPVIPPSNLNVALSGSSATLSWTASTDTDLVGYHVYRASSLNGTFTRLTSTPVAGNNFIDSVAAGYTYMVRAVKLEKSGSGSYYNASQGIFAGNGSTGSTPPPPTVTIPSAPSMLAALPLSPSQITLSWVDNANNETAYKIYRKVGVNGTYALVATLAANSVTYANSGLAAGTQYYFRIVASNSAGDSSFSNESVASTHLATVAAPVITPGGGSFTGSVTVSITGPAGSTIRYTTNGTVPVATSTVYSAPFALKASATVKARAFATGLNESSVSSSTFAVSQPTSLVYLPTKLGWRGADWVRKGNWKGEYGSEGYNVIGNAAKIPSSAHIRYIGHLEHLWQSSTSDVRALEKINSTDRVAGCYYSSTSFDVEIDLINTGKRLALYFEDWDRLGRSQKVEVFDAVSGSLLHSYTMSNFGDGVYLNYDFHGRIRIRVTRLAGPNAVMNGLFIRWIGSVL
ncbi:MAG: FN3 associated domain-containing protein [Verrucomicrobiota bacterium]|nr:FN3 associated domain-containing protein [Verrucomicrobiota bacterium]